MGDIKVTYTCPLCGRHYDVEECIELVEQYNGDYEYLCKDDGTPLKWGLE